MEEELLIEKTKDRELNGGGGVTVAAFGEELVKLGYVAAPMAAVISSQYLLQTVSIMMAGHVSEISLSSTAIAISLAAVTGFSVLAANARERLLKEELLTNDRLT